MWKPNLEIAFSKKDSICLLCSSVVSCGSRVNVLQEKKKKMSLVRKKFLEHTCKCAHAPKSLTHFCLLLPQLLLD